MKRILTALVLALSFGGAALAFTPTQKTDLANNGYTPATNKEWNYRYTKNVGGCTITITESSANKYDIKATGGYSTRIWPVPASKLLVTAFVVEDICVNS